MAKRSRTSIACIPCKAAKTKCSEVRPCKHCITNRTIARCTDSRSKTAPNGITAKEKTNVDNDKFELIVNPKEICSKSSGGSPNNFEESRNSEPNSRSNCDPYDVKSASQSMRYTSLQESRTSWASPENHDRRSFQLGPSLSYPIPQHVQIRQFSGNHASYLPPPREDCDALQHTDRLPPIRLLLSRPPQLQHPLQLQHAPIHMQQQQQIAIPPSMAALLAAAVAASNDPLRQLVSAALAGAPQPQADAARYV